MKKNIKGISLILLSAVISTAACTSETLDQKNQRELIASIRDVAVVIPTIDRGGLSGNILFDLGTIITSPNVTIQVIRENDIPKLDSNGKPVINTTTKQPDTVEKAGDIIYKSTIINKSQFLISDLRPGGVILRFTALKVDPVEIKANIEAGKINNITGVIIGQASKVVPTPKTNLNVSGKVVTSDGTVVSGAKVADVTGGFVNSFVNTASDGTFSLPVNAFTTSRNLEISQGNLITSFAVTADKTEGLTIPLIANSRTVKGTIYDSVIKTKPVANLSVKVDGTQISTTTDKNGTFTLRGVSVSPTTIQIGNLDGFVNYSINVPSAQNSNDYSIGNSFIVPIGNVFVNLIADNTPLVYADENNNVVRSSYLGPVSYLNRAVDTTKSSLGIIPNVFDPYTITTTVVGAATATTQGNYQLPGQYQYMGTAHGGSFEYSNQIVFNAVQHGVIQFEGTNIVKNFDYPVTPFRIVTVFEAGAGGVVAQKDISVPNPNQLLSVPVNNIPGGEYTISISLDHHQTQKGLKIVIPSNDTISTELIQMRLAQSVLSVGDVTGKIVFRAANNRPITAASGLTIRVAALKSAEEQLSTTRINQILSSDTTQSLDVQTSVYNSDGTYSYRLRNISTGTRLIIAGVVNSSGKLDANYLPNTYVLLNVVGGIVNNAPDLALINPTGVESSPSPSPVNQ
ncbi:MAG: hypothetical protein H7263_10465 [Candidatus Sericytochromatia bacterium]|nr:hypothetical protein [Candidatus Sericytochromatia bacterium]